MASATSVRIGLTAPILPSSAAWSCQKATPTSFPVDLSAMKFTAVKPFTPFSVGIIFSLSTATASSILLGSPSIVLMRAYILSLPSYARASRPSRAVRVSFGRQLGGVRLLVVEDRVDFDVHAASSHTAVEVLSELCELQ